MHRVIASFVRDSRKTSSPVMNVAGLITVALILLFSIVSANATPALAATGATPPSGGPRDTAVCSQTPAPGYVRCFARVRTDITGVQAHPANAATPAVSPAVVGSAGGPYDPTYLQSAYNLTVAAGSLGG